MSEIMKLLDRVRYKNNPEIKGVVIESNDDEFTVLFSNKNETTFTQMQKSLEKNDRVIITIAGGVGDLQESPDDIIVEIRDYDIENEVAEEADENCGMVEDEDGEWYQEIIFGE